MRTAMLLGVAFGALAGWAPSMPGAPGGPDGAEMLRPFVPSISLDADRRVDLPDYARRERMNTAQLHRRFGASGLVRCGGAVGTAQLTLRADIITTAAHVLIGPQGASQACTFEPLPGLGAGAVAINAASIRAGSSNPRAEPAARDWAVARLVAPVAGAVPYGLGALQKL